MKKDEPYDLQDDEAIDDSWLYADIVKSIVGDNVNNEKSYDGWDG